MRVVASYRESQAVDAQGSTSARTGACPRKLRLEFVHPRGEPARRMDEASIAPRRGRRLLAVEAADEGRSEEGRPHGLAAIELAEALHCLGCEIGRNPLSVGHV